MANSKQNFLGLVKIEGIQTSAYNSLDTTGKLVFAHLWDSVSEDVKVNERFIINANGVEYKIATEDIFESLEARVRTLEEWKSIVDTSIDAIHTKDSEQDTSISDISTRLSNVTITAIDNSIGINNSSIALANDNYVSLTAANNTVTASIKDSALVKGTGTGSGDVSLATKGYVDELVTVLEQALVFKGEITAANASIILTDGDVQTGYTYVATTTGEYNSSKFEVGDLIIVKADAVAGTPAEIIVVERNLDGAVTAGAALDSSHLVVGTGAQGIKTIGVTAEDLANAIANANNALQTVTASTSTGEYVTIEVARNTSTANVSVGVITATLADASNGSTGLAMAEDVYDELTKVEEVMATSVTTMADTLGLDSSLGVTWSAQSGIDPTATYKEAIEGAYEESHKAGVTSFGGATGAISVATASDATHNVVFNMNSSTLEANVDLSDIDASIDRLDASVNALESWKNDSSFVNTVEGEAVVASANTTFVYVNANPSDGDVKLTSGVVLANNAYGSTTATGLATDAFVQDYLAWEVIGD